MQNARVILIAMGMCLLVSPNQAYAGRGVWEWLERLSGPGPFHGWAVEVPVACQVVESGSGDERWNHLWRCWSPLTFERGQADTRGQTRAWDRRLYVSAYIGRYTGAASDLQYAIEPPTRDIVWWRVGSTVTWEAHRFFDITTGLQWNRLSSKEGVFESLSAASIQLMGITWRPCGGCSATSPWRHISVPLRATLLARSSDAADFGAIPGTFESRPEVQFQWGIVFDLWR
jgi:hypothetical protein